MSYTLDTSSACYTVGDGAVIEEEALVGVAYEGWASATCIGRDCKIRRRTVIFADVRIGDRTETGMGAYIREHTYIGHDCIIGTSTIIEGHAELADYVIVQSGVFIPTETRIGSRVFVGPRVVMTNDRYPLRMRAHYAPDGPVLGDDVTIGANATILPGVRIGPGAVVAAGAVVVHDVPAWSLAIGVPARICDLPDKLHEPNKVRRRG